MKIKKNFSKKRREFLKSMARIGLLAGFVTLGFKLGLRKDSENDDAINCYLNIQCGGCKSYHVCTDPRALSYKSQPNTEKINKYGENGEQNGG